MKPIAIGNEKAFQDYCKKKKYSPILFPQELEHEDKRNEGYHFVYEKDLYHWMDSQSIATPFVLLFGSGDYHHITHAVLKQVIDPSHENYSVLLIDNHSDCEDINVGDTKGAYPVNCATHMRESLRKTRMLECIHVHKKEKVHVDWYDKQVAKRSHVEVTDVEPGLDIDTSLVQSILDNFYDKVYITIDIDALGHGEVDIEQYQAYDQGKMTLPELLLILKQTLAQKTVLGIDVCGMSKDNRAVHVYEEILRIIDESGYGK